MSSIDVQCLGVFFLKTPANNHQWPFESQQSTFNVLKVLLCTFRACRQLLRIFFFFFFPYCTQGSELWGDVCTKCFCFFAWLDFSKKHSSPLMALSVEKSFWPSCLPFSQPRPEASVAQWLHCMANMCTYSPFSCTPTWLRLFGQPKGELGLEVYLLS